MQMTFTTNINGQVLFNWWNVKSPAQYAVSCVGIFVLAFLFEALSEFRAAYNKRILAASRADPLLGKVQSHSSPRDAAEHAASLEVRIVRTLLHMVQLTFSYFIMLIAMTYNVGYFMCIVGGAGAGYFAFAKVRAASSEVASCCSHSDVVAQFD
eukprot:TRINITY_DN10017_c0_g1_i1.p1 TRINITY_DN10017_c0_g1~~TRINITY_DN10017_c0_g1_i1.p1  ORF type:complete len:154 (+),score=48.06 TRINITY_DN10017_c0_g1_i1:62-523(+)